MSPRPHFLVIFLALLLPLTAQAAHSIVLYSHSEGGQAAYAGQLAEVTRKALDSLERFQVQDVRPLPAEARNNVTLLLDQASAEGIPWVADLRVIFDKKKRAHMTLDLYESDKALRNVRITKTYKAKNFKALLAKMEYELPRALKGHFLELGRVIKKERRMIYFDLGETAGTRPDELYVVYREEGEITDDEGNSYGRLERTTGIVRVTRVTGVYATAEILVGELSIRTGDHIKRMENQDRAYEPRILSVLENRVAINIGKRYGVEEGSYYAVHKDIKAINDEAAFRQPIGFIRINEVFDDYATGELELSPAYDLARYILKEGDRISEVSSPKKDSLALQQILFNVNGVSRKMLLATFIKHSASNVNIAYRLRGGYNGGAYLATGVMHSLGHSPNFYAGVDFAALSGMPINLFISADLKTPFARDLKLTMESGYTLGANDTGYNGINTSIGVRYGFDWL